MKFIAVVAFSCVVIAAGSAESVDECLRRDSISCVQRSLFRKAKEFFDRESFDIFSGVSLVKGEDEGTGPSRRSARKLVYEQELQRAASVTERQTALEIFLGEEIGNFITGRSLRINFMPIFDKIGESARAFTESIPAEVREAATEVAEGRGKKKLMKSILPLLLAAKIKIGALATLAYFGIALLAKKAILASVISIAISSFLGLKALWYSKAHAHDATSYNAGWPSGGGLTPGWPVPASSSGWSSGSGWDDVHGSYSIPNQAYSGYHR